MGTFVITGATHGMGAAIYALLREEGHRVFGVARSGADIQADVGSAEGRAAVLDALRRAASQVDGVVTCAAVNANRKIRGADIVSVNYFGTVTLLEGLRPLLQRADAPAALAIGSVAASTRSGPPEVTRACLGADEDAARSASTHLAADNGGVYAAAKLALARWVRRAAVTSAWAGAGIALNMITPGWVRTRSTAAKLDDPAEAARALGVTPVNRAATPEEFARLARFMLGADARFFCGANLYWDGGTDAALRPDAWPVPPPAT
jgi:NAD(P)-dependent dehydrogenase (short-subunit alcohol dehydrogenase family)